MDRIGNSSFPKSKRLCTSGDFNRVFKKRKRYNFENLSVLVSGNELNYPRIGFAISKKNVKRACRRNLIRRILREKFRKTEQLIHADLVIVANANLNLLGPNELRTSCEQVWSDFLKRLSS